jgi:hypothetical protein
VVRLLAVAHSIVSSAKLSPGLSRKWSLSGKSDRGDQPAGRN